MTNAYDIQAIQTRILSENQEKAEKLKNRVKKFSAVANLEEAKALASTEFRANDELQEFSVAGVKCVIINKDDLFRISYITQSEFVCYDFS